MEYIFSKIADHSDANKQASKRMGKMSRDILNIRKQNLTMGSYLEQIGQQLGLQAMSKDDGGFTTTKTHEPYKSPPFRDSFGTPAKHEQWFEYR